MNTQQKKRYKEMFNNPKVPKEIRNLMVTGTELMFDILNELKYSDKKVTAYLKKHFKSKHTHTGKVMNYIYNGKQITK